MLHRIRSSLSPFKVRSFRFQWPSDLLTSLAFEMETLILGWYILVETNSVFWLTLFGSLQFLGTLVAPMFGVMGDRMGRRRLLFLMRIAYTVLAVAIMAFDMIGVLNPVIVFIIAFIAGMIRPSDLVMRNALIGDTIPSDQLVQAVSVSRITMDSARIVGALTGAGLFSQLGMSYAYLAVGVVYLASAFLTLGVTGNQPQIKDVHQVSPWRDLRIGMVYAWSTPLVLAMLWLAFLVNITAFPISNGLLPYVAKEIYQVDENGLSHLVAAFAIGALLGSLIMTFLIQSQKPSRLMMIGIWVWHILLICFAFVETKTPGFVFLVLIGLSQSLGMISMAVTLIATTDPQFRGRIMGVRMLAVYGLPIGLFASSGLIELIGFQQTASIYGVAGLIISAAIAYRWRDKIWAG